ncbi:sulfofructose kinase [Lutibacter oricola]|uniref:Sulfofructose kinase n=1 Tax=Lutibacter oricola TaxID=762486 RepID=A0A1H2W6R1_9FLAO|nr:carbohydrate kinase family protein [Lutibacter oricola]SDW75964.1 sulfofructose kinase [Lutibacter oricola]
MQFDVIVSGMMVVDILSEVPSTIKKGAKHEVSKILVQGGAPAGNAACVIAQNNLKTAFLGYKANNTLSLIANEELKKCDVDTSLLIESKNFQPAIAVVEVDPNNGDRTVFYSTNNYKPLQPKDINEEWIKNSRLLLVDGYDVVGNLELLKIAKKHSIPSVLDIEAGDISILKEMISLGSHIILPLEGAQMISGLETPEECIKSLSKLTKGLLVITDGANGSWALENHKIIHQAAFPTKVVDTTGCGDAFHGAYASALLKGRNLAERMEYASAYASIIAAHFGGRSYFPTMEEVQQKILKK